MLLIWTTKSYKIKYFCLGNDKSRAWWLYFVYTQNTLEKATHQFAEGVFRQIVFSNMSKEKSVELLAPITLIRPILYFYNHYKIFKKMIKVIIVFMIFYEFPKQ